MCAGDEDSGRERGQGVGEGAATGAGSSVVGGEGTSSVRQGTMTGARAAGPDQRERVRVALLVDGDHISPLWMGAVVTQLECDHVVSPRLVVADWGKLQSNGWGMVLARWAMRGVHQPGYISGKNATDVALVIAAMDLLHAGEAGAFALVSGDSDFTPLAVRLREAGKRVMGFGPHAASGAFRAACDGFWELPLVEMRGVGGRQGGVVERSAGGAKEVGTEIGERTALELGERLIGVYERLKAEGRAVVTLAALANAIYRDWRGFRPQQYGHGTFLRLVRGTGLFELERREEGKGSTALEWVLWRRVVIGSGGEDAGDSVQMVEDGL